MFKDAHFSLQFFEKLPCAALQFASTDIGVWNFSPLENCQMLHFFEIYLVNVAAAKWNFLN